MAVTIGRSRVGFRVVVLLVAFSLNIQYGSTSAETCSFRSEFKSEAECTTDSVLAEVKMYLESDDFGYAVSSYNAALVINPQTIWENLQAIENICDSEEARLIQIFCGNPNKVLTAIRSLWVNEKNNLLRIVKFFKTPNLQTFGLFVILLSHRTRNGKKLKHFCDRVHGIPFVKLDFDMLESQLGKIRKYSLLTGHLVNSTILDLKVSQHIQDYFTWNRKESLEKAELRHAISNVEKRLDSRLANVEKRLDSRLAKVEKRLDSRLAKVEKRLDSRLAKVEKRLDSRLAKVEKRLTNLEENVVEVDAKVEGLTTKLVNHILATAIRFGEVEQKPHKIETTVTQQTQSVTDLTATKTTSHAEGSVQHMADDLKLGHSNGHLNGES